MATGLEGIAKYLEELGVNAYISVPDRAAEKLSVVYQFAGAHCDQYIFSECAHLASRPICDTFDDAAITHNQHLNPVTSPNQTIPHAPGLHATSCLHFFPVSRIPP